MNGILKKINGGWVVEWSDLHSCLHGWHMMETPLHPDDIEQYLHYNEKGELHHEYEGKNVEFELIITGYDEESFIPFKYAKLSI